MNIYWLRNKNDIKIVDKLFNNYELNNSDSEEILIIDVSQFDINIDWTFRLSNFNSKLKINYFCLNKQDFHKIIKICVIHEVEHTFSYIKFHGIGFNKSITNLSLCSKNNIKPLASIYSEQIIKYVLMDDAIFSGIPEIDAANNSFTSAHKLLVGGLNKEELFYLNSLGINETQSINILIKTLYQAFLLNLKKDVYSEWIWKEVETSNVKKL